MLAQLFEAIVHFWERLSPCTVIPVFEGAGVLRLGKYHRTLGPGLHWKWPLIEGVIYEYTAMRTLRLQPQTCTTWDKKGVVVEGVVKYKISDVEPYICGVVDQKDVLIDVSMGAILKSVCEMTFDELVEGPPENKIASSIRRQVSKFGFEILAFTFTDIGLVRSIRLIGHSTAELPLE